MNHNRRYAGRTLVETIVSVALCAIVVSVVLAAPKRIRQDDRWINCLSHLQQLGQASINHTTQYNGYFQLAASADMVDYVDPARTKYAYGGGELLAFPVALAQAMAKPYTCNPDWGARAGTLGEAVGKQQYMADDFPEMTCPADTLRIATPGFPNGDGMIGNGDPSNPLPPGPGVEYWGRLSYALNEDIAGANALCRPACWRAVDANGQWVECLGGYMYGPSSSCFGCDHGNRLEGRIDQVVDPSTVGLLFDAGFASKIPSDLYSLLNLVNSTTAPGASAQFAGPDLENFEQAQSRTITQGNLHPGGRINVLYADYHTESVRPLAPVINTIKFPTRYEPRVRISPYDPHGFGEE